MATPSVAEEEAAIVAPPPPPQETATATATAMEPANTDLFGSGAREASETDAAVARRFSNQVDAMISKANELEQRVKELTDFYTHKKQPKNLKWISSCLKDKTDGAQKEPGCSERMQEVMCQFGTILKQLSAHKWAEPFLEPVDVKGLRLRDYYKIIKRPMDFSTIQKQMEANVYKNAREIYADVRLVFSNAMTYNEDNKHDIHVMAKTLQQKFEEKWIHLIPKVVAAEKRQIDEEAQALAAQEAAIAKLARDTNNELNHLNLLIEELRESVMQRCRKMSTEEKRKLSSGIASLCPEYLFKALELIAQSNPNFQDSAEEVDIDIDAQSEITLRRLKFFVKGALENQAKNSATKAKNQSADADDISNRKRVICDALAKTARKRSKKLSTVS